MSFRNITVFGKALRAWLGCLFQSWKHKSSSDYSLTDLLRYDDHLLMDIGVSREDILRWLQESRRKTWGECLREAKRQPAQTRRARRRDVSCET